MTIGIEETRYSLPEGSTLDLCVVLTGAFGESPSVTVTLTSVDSGSATGFISTITENADYLPVSTEFTFSQQQRAVQCVSVRLLEDDDPNEGTEQFNVILSMSSPVTNVILSPTSAIVHISESVTSILSDLSVIANSNDQTEDNLQFISGVVEDIANSASNGELEVSMEVCVYYF